MSPSAMPVVFGGASICSETYFSKPDVVPKLLDLMQSYGITTIDTAQIYGDSEELLGKFDAGKRFTIDTKAPGGLKPGSATEEEIVKEGKASLERLGVDKVDIFYLHAPDPTVPLPSTLAGINTLHRSGAFARFGLSNYKAPDVQAIYDHCKTNDYVLPSVYQGNYNPVARLTETVLFPTLRKLDIAFYAYSPLAGGFLTKSKQEILDGKGRFVKTHSVGEMYLGLYAKPALLEALAQWEAVAKEAGVSRAELAYRWVMYHSELKAELGDAVIIGCSSFEQLEQTMEGLEKGPLGEETCKGIERVWKTIEHEAPLDNING